MERLCGGIRPFMPYLFQGESTSDVALLSSIPPSPPPSGPLDSDNASFLGSRRLGVCFRAKDRDHQLHVKEDEKSETQVS